MPDSFKNRLVFAMQQKNIKAADLAKKTGLSKAQISQYTNGIYEAKQTALYKLAVALDVSEPWLMGYDVSPLRRIDVVPSPNNKDGFSSHERKVIEAYRSNPAMQPAVDRLLGVAPEAPSEAPTVAEDIASTLSAAMEKSRVKK